MPMSTDQTDKDTLDKEPFDKDTAIFVPNSWDNGEDGGRVTTPEELEKFRLIDGHAVEEMMDLAVEIKSADHLRDLCEEHFEGDAYSIPATFAEYRDRASREKLLDDARRELRMAFYMARGEAPSEIDGATGQSLRGLMKDLRADLDESEFHLSRARSFFGSAG